MRDIFPETANRVKEWAAQEDVLGVVLVGSRSGDHADELSDDDLEVLLTDEAGARLAPAECIDLLAAGEGSERTLIYDAQYTTLTDLRRKAGSPFDLDRWPYERARVLFDRNGDVAPAVKAAHYGPDLATSASLPLETRSSTARMWGRMYSSRSMKGTRWRTRS